MYDWQAKTLMKNRESENICDSVLALLEQIEILENQLQEKTDELSAAGDKISELENQIIELENQISVPY